MVAWKGVDGFLAVVAPDEHGQSCDYGAATGALRKPDEASGRRCLRWFETTRRVADVDLAPAEAV
jgi:hypothetical protein